MKKLHLTRFRIPRKSLHPSKSPNAVEHNHVLELSWICDTCKYKNKHQILAKGAYSEADLLKAVQATFNMAHYECVCDEEEKSTKPPIQKPADNTKT